MRTHVLDSGPYSGVVVKINQEFVFRGTDYVSFKKHVENGYYWGSYDKEYEFSTFVATNIDGACYYCCGWMPYDYNSSLSRIAAIYDEDIVFRKIDGTYAYLGNRSILLAIDHERYPLILPTAEEGIVISGKISLDDIVIIKTERDLLKVLPSPNKLQAKTIQSIKRNAGIFS